MNKKQKALVILLTPFVLGFLLGLLVGGGCSRKDRKADETRTEQIIEEADAAADDVDGTGDSTAKEIIYYTRMIPYSQTFNDINDVHLAKAKAVGLRKIPGKRDDIDLRRLIRIEDSDDLVIDDLTYSVPYLTQGAAAELNRIAKAFGDSLRSKQFPVYKLVVSSILRTEEDVEKLRKSGNPNASDNSAHCYGTTFDITYTRYYRDEETDEFMQPYELTKVLAEVLRDEKKAGRVLVKYERKEHCFHITATQTK